MLLLFMFILIGCQNKEVYTLKADDQYFAYSYQYPEHVVMLSKQDDQYVLLALKEVNQVMEIYRVIQMPGITGVVSISSFYLLEDETPEVTLIIDGEIKKYDTVKRVSFSGTYYALEYKPNQGGFNASVTDSCFGKDNPCPFNVSRDAFTTGPYVDYEILSSHVEHVDKLSRFRENQSGWYTIGIDKFAIYHVLAKYQNNLYKLKVQVIDGQVVYESNLIASLIKTARYIHSNRTALVIHDDMTYQLFNDDLQSIDTGQLDGTYKDTIQFQYKVAVETDTHYYLFVDGILKESILKATNLPYMAGLFQETSFKYYYIEQNQLKFNLIQL